MKKIKFRKTIKYLIVSIILQISSRLVEIYFTNTQTRSVLLALKDGNNSVADYTKGFPFYISLVLSIAAIVVLVVGIIKLYKENTSKENE